MVSKESLINDLEKCAGQAAAVLYLIIGNDAKAEVDDSYKMLEASKQPVYDDTLFTDISSLLSKLIDESISDEEKALIGKLVAQIDLASFAYHISQDDEFERCANAYFQRVVSSFNKYTKNEIQLFLCLHLYLLRQEMNLKTNVDRTKLIKRHLPKDQDAYFLGDTSSEKKAGRCQIMMVVNMVSEFLFSRVSELDGEIRFGAPVMVNKFLQEFIRYRLGEDFSCEPDRELEQGFPETKDEMKALVDEIFNDKFIDKTVEEAEASNSNTNAPASDNNTDEYAEEDSEQEGEDSDSESDAGNSSSDDSSPAPPMGEKSSTEVSAYSPGNENTEEYMEEEEEEEEEEDSTTERTTENTSGSEANTTRHRITDEQPDARTVTAQEAGFSDSADVGSTSNNNASGSRRQQKSSSNQQNLRKRRAPVSRDSESSISDVNSASTSVNGGEGQEETTAPLKFHICDDGKARPVSTIPKIREKAQRWTEPEVQALEEGMRYYKTTAWSAIHDTFKDVLGSHKPTQLKDKAKNEVNRRRKKGIPLGGFKYFLNPQSE